VISTDEIWIFGDGACKGNPGPGGWGVLAASSERLTEWGGYEELSTNNIMELTALLKALELIEGGSFSAKKIRIYFDSKYVLSGAKAWRFNWDRNGWLTAEGAEVKNRLLWKEIHERLKALSERFQFEYFYVPGHSGVAGNERVDEIASGFAEGLPPELYQGELKTYGLDLSDGLKLAEEFSLDRNRTSAAKKLASKAYYLSVIAGQVFRDDTWKLCEARVKGVAGARYKKVSSAEEESECLKKWGLKPGI
jgi:ribonuclease HI